MSSIAVIGIDPGATTGLFFYRYLRGQHRVIHKHLEPYQVPSELSSILSYNGPLVKTNRLHIAVEKFIINARTARLSQQPEALEVTGMVKATLYLKIEADVEAETLHQHFKQYMKSNLKFASDEALKRAGWYGPGMRHANDAARQAFALLKDKNYPLWCRVSEGAMIESDDR